MPHAVVGSTSCAPGRYDRAPPNGMMSYMLTGKLVRIANVGARPVPLIAVAWLMAGETGQARDVPAFSEYGSPDRNSTATWSGGSPSAGTIGQVFGSELPLGIRPKAETSRSWPCHRTSIFTVSGHVFATNAA